MTILPHIVERHADEAASLWDTRDRAVSAPHFTLRDLANLDRRIEANLEGLGLAGEEGWKICREVLGLKAPGDVFAVAAVALAGGEKLRIQEVVEAGCRPPAASRGLTSALAWLPAPAVETYLESLPASPEPALRRVGLAALAARRRNPCSLLKRALGDNEPAVRARALRAVGELGLVSLRPLVRPHLKAADPASRFWAAWSAALLGPDSEAVEVLLSEAESLAPWGERAVQLAARVMERNWALVWIRKLATSQDQARLAVLGAGARGVPELVPWLLEQMRVPALARIAGEAFTLITGADLRSPPLAGEKPEGFQAGPTEDPDDEDVAPDPDEFLPWPNPAGVEQWWTGRRKEFAEGTRYLLGKALSPEWLNQVLRAGRQRQRHAAAIELALRHPGQPLFEVRAPGPRQQQALGPSARQAARPGAEP